MGRTNVDDALQQFGTRKRLLVVGEHGGTEPVPEAATLALYSALRFQIPREECLVVVRRDGRGIVWHLLHLGRDFRTFVLFVGELREDATCTYKQSCERERESERKKYVHRQ